MLQQHHVDTLDLRELIHKDGLSHHELFFRTDHHWTGKAGLWATRQIVQHHKDRYGFDTDLSVLDEQNFELIEYPAAFLGSQGNKKALSQAELDDFPLLYPMFSTSFHYQILERCLDIKGDLSIFYDINKSDLHPSVSYNSYAYGPQALHQIENLNLNTNSRVLIIGDSFICATIPFLSTSYNYVDAIDLRYFTGSVQTFIKKTNPDLVILLYNPSMLNGDSNVLFGF